ncbi:MAG: sporulation protein YabP [Thermotaleaceae bacterium]
MEERKAIKNKSQSIILENRERLSISGVEHVTSFNENIILLETIEGGLIIKGRDLDIARLNLEDGNLVINGHVQSMQYTDKESSNNKGGSFLGRMFK